VKAALSGLLSPEKKEAVLGLVEIARSTRYRRSAPWPDAMVLERHSEARFARSPAARQCRDPRRRTGHAEAVSRTTCVRSKAGFECGLSLKNYNDIKERDQLEIYEVQEVARTL